MASFKKSVTFSHNTIFIERPGNSRVPRIDPPLPNSFKSALWYSQRELAYIEYAEYRDACSARRRAAAAAAATATTATTTISVQNPILAAARAGGGCGSPRTLVFS